MPVCNTCGGEEFDYSDGLYYCSVCQTQTQEMQEEEHEDTVAVSHSAALQKAAPLKKKEQKVVDHGRPWRSHEGFQVILKEQVKAVIRMGAHEKLQDIVFKLWAAYLSKIGVAFTEDTGFHGAYCHVKMRRSRDQYPGTSKRPLPKPIRKRQTLLAHHGIVPKLSELERKREEETVKASLETTDFYEGDDPFSDDSTDDDDVWIKIAAEQEGGSDDDKLEVDKEVLGPGEKRKVTRRHMRKSITWPSMNKTLTILHLGLLYTQSLFTASDIVRWANEGKIPYFNASAVFPANMKFSYADATTFNRAPKVSVQQLLAWSSRMAAFLDIQHLVMPNIRKLASRFVVQLCLPGELHGLLHKLMQDEPEIYEHDVKQTDVMLPNVDVTAMAYIIVLLKLLLGLDDVTESELSKYAEELQVMLQDRQKLFVWKKWKIFMDQYVYKLIGSQLPNNTQSVSDVQNLKTCLDQSKRLSSAQRICDNAKKDLAALKEDFIESVQAPLNALLAKYEKASDSAGRTSEEFNLHATLETDPLNELLNSPPYGEPRNNSADVGTGDEFRSSSLKYILQGETFLEEMDKQGLSDFTVRSSCASGAGSDSDAEDDEMDKMSTCSSSYNPSQDLFHSQSRIKQKRSSRTKIIVQEKLNKMGSPLKESPVSKNKYDQLRQHYKRAYEQYSMNNDKDLGTTTQHQSYLWLLDICSFFIGTPPSVLHQEVLKLQVTHIV